MDPLAPIDANRMRNVDPDQWMKDMEARIADLKGKTADLADNLATATATVTSRDGAVVVTIAPTGALQNLELTGKAAGMSPSQLTTSIMEAVRKGQRGASEKMVEAFAPLGAGTESMNLVLSYLPPAEDDEEEERDYFPAEDVDETPAPQPVQPPPPPQPAPRPRPAVEDDEDNEPW